MGSHLAFIKSKNTSNINDKYLNVKAGKAKDFDRKKIQERIQPAYDNLHIGRVPSYQFCFLENMFKPKRNQNIESTMIETKVNYSFPLNQTQCKNTGHIHDSLYLIRFVSNQT